MTPQQVKRIIQDSEANGVEELILAKSTLVTLDTGYQTEGIDSPEWVTDGLGTLSREITSRNRAELERQLKASLSRREALATVDEKRATLDEKIKALEEKLK